MSYRSFFQGEKIMDIAASCNLKNYQKKGRAVIDPALMSSQVIPNHKPLRISITAKRKG
jgi:hypothetical protein